MTDASYAAWLKAPSLYATAEVAGAAAKWGDLAIDADVISPLAQAADAVAVAQQVATFMAGPLARDRAVVKGYRADLTMRMVTLSHRRLGYDAAPTVLVLSAVENGGQGTTTLQVLKRI